MGIELTATTLALLWAGGFLGGMAAGASGFAFGAVASSIWLHVITPLQAAMLIVTGGLIMHCGLTIPLWRSLDMRRLSPFLIAGLVGIPIGVALVVKTDPGAIRRVLAVFMTVFGVYAIAAPTLPRIAGGGKAADAAIGFVGGILGGLAGLSGILPAIWTQVRGWPKDVARGVYQPFILVAHLGTLLLFGFVAIEPHDLVLFAVAIPSVLIGAWVGWMIYGKLDERSFRRIFAGLLIVSGVSLML